MKKSIEELAETLVKNEVYLNVSSIVDLLARNAKNLEGLDSEVREALDSAFMSPPEYEEAAQDAGWRRAKEDGILTKGGKFLPGEFEEHTPPGNAGGYLGIAYGIFFPDSEPVNAGEFYHAENRETMPASDWEDLCCHENIDPYYSEVFEHWAVSDWLADDLEVQGENVLRDVVGFSAIWCRTTCGQAIKIDGVICRIAADLIRETA